MPMRGELSLRSDAIKTDHISDVPLPLLLFTAIGTIAFIAFAIILQHFDQLPTLITEYNLM
jgi:hypothetical protein